MEKKIQKILYAMGVFRCSYGYLYFIRAVERAVESPERTRHMDKEIYRPIALEFNQRPGSIQKGISAVRDTIMKSGGAEHLSQMVGGYKWERNIPYPKELIDIFAYYIENQEDDS